MDIGLRVRSPKNRKEEGVEKYFQILSPPEAILKEKEKNRNKKNKKVEKPNKKERVECLIVLSKTDNEAKNYITLDNRNILTGDNLYEGRIDLTREQAEQYFLKENDILISKGIKNDSNNNIFTLQINSKSVQEKIKKVGIQKIIPSNNFMILRPSFFGVEENEKNGYLKKCITLIAFFLKHKERDKSKTNNRFSKKELLSMDYKIFFKENIDLVYDLVINYKRNEEIYEQNLKEKSNKILEYIQKR